MSDKKFSGVVHKDFHEAVVKRKDAQIKEMQEVINKLGKMGDKYADIDNWNYSESSREYSDDFHHDWYCKIKDDYEEVVENKTHGGKLARETMSDEQVKQYYRGGE